MVFLCFVVGGQGLGNLAHGDFAFFSYFSREFEHGIEVLVISVGFSLLNYRGNRRYLASEDVLFEGLGLS